MGNNGIKFNGINSNFFQSVSAVDTTNAAIATIYNIFIPANSACLLKCYIVANNKTTANESACWEYDVKIYKAADGATASVSTAKLISSTIDASMASCTVAFGGITDNVSIVVTGLASTSIHWICGTLFLSMP